VNERGAYAVIWMSSCIPRRADERSEEEGGGISI
jgi:hypothetical protein